jgi:putative transposase
MIDREHDLPITKQAKALGISRGSVYYLPRPVPAADLAVMRRMDELHLEFPFAGSRMLRNLLNQDGIGRQRVATLMKRMGIEAIYRKPNTSKPAPGHKIYPYLLRGMVIDWFSRRVLSWRLSITMETGFLHRGAGGSHCPPWPAGDLQHRPGLAVHQPRLYQGAD